MYGEPLLFTLPLASAGRRTACQERPAPHLKRHPDTVTSCRTSMAEVSGKQPSPAAELLVLRRKATQPRRNRPDDDEWQRDPRDPIPIRSVRRDKAQQSKRLGVSIPGVGCGLILRALGLPFRRRPPHTKNDCCVCECLGKLARALLCRFLPDPGLARGGFQFGIRGTQAQDAGLRHAEPRFVAVVVVVVQGPCGGSCPVKIPKPQPSHSPSAPGARLHLHP